MGFPIYSHHSYHIYPINKRYPDRKIGYGKVRTLFLLFVGTLVLIALSGCTKTQCILAITADPSNPYVNQIVQFVGSVSPSEEESNILEWQWNFGDGGTALGKQTWHQFRSYNKNSDDSVIPWVVKLTVTHANGSKYVAIQKITVHSESKYGLAGYYLRHATTECTDIAGSRPEPSGQDLEYVQQDVLTGWWRVENTTPFFLLAELHFVPNSVDQVRCVWNLYSHGKSRTGYPRFVKTLLTDVRAVQHNAPYFYNVGFPLQVLPSNEFPSSGWYQIIAVTSSLDGRYRTYIDFMIKVDY